MMVTRAHTSTDVSPRGDLPSGCFSNYNWPPPLAIEVVDAKRQIHRAFARPAAGRRDRGEMRWRPFEVDRGGGRAADSLMRAELRVVDEADLDLLHQVFRRHRPQYAEAECVLQCPPQSLDQGDRALLSDRPEPLLHAEP